MLTSETTQTHLYSVQEFLSVQHPARTVLSNFQQLLIPQDLIQSVTDGVYHESWVNAMCI